MKIAVRPLIFGSHINLLQTKFASIAVSFFKTRQYTMANLRTAAEYESGTSSVAYITTPDEATANKLARGLVDARLAACVNIIPKITSIYVWENKVQEDNECMLMAKTMTNKVKELTKYVRDNHPYSVAEVITLPIQDGNLPYLEWIKQTVKEPTIHQEN